MLLEEIMAQLEGHFEVSINVLAPSNRGVRAKRLWFLQFVDSGRDDTKCPLAEGTKVGKTGPQIDTGLLTAGRLLRL